MTNTTIKRFKNSLYKLERYKCKYRSNLLPSFLNDTIIGLLLSDGSLEKSSPTSSARLAVVLGEKHLAYLLHLYNLLEPLTDNLFSMSTVFNKKEDKYYNIVKFKTASLPIFLYYHKLFYKYNEEKRKYIKIVPYNIDILMSPVVLAHLIMGDGNFKAFDNIVRIYTNSFHKLQVEVLAKSINNKLKIKTSVMHDRNNQYIITIGRNQLDKLRQTIRPYVHPSMLYKLGERINKQIKFDYFQIKNQI